MCNYMVLDVHMSASLSATTCYTSQLHIIVLDVHKLRLLLCYNLLATHRPPLAHYIIPSNAPGQTHQFAHSIATKTFEDQLIILR